MYRYIWVQMYTNSNVGLRTRDELPTIFQTQFVRSVSEWYTQFIWKLSFQMRASGAARECLTYAPVIHYTHRG